ncbi:MAG: hypothetical protein H6916_11255 [Novosphingobium sp.]|nr:hypothetical protein [Novosphingobium sp.]MCB2058154.1 hypothetical protein [Novosphingobium sp.]MCP5387369.1 hypothetical protein [Novosphingobium sp.]
MQTDEQGQRAADRRGEDRRKAQLSPLPFPDRRKAARRSGTDRRAAARG